MQTNLINEDLAPTRPEQRTWSMWNIAALWIGMAVCIPTYTLASGMVSQGWSWRVSVAAVFLGNLIVLFPMILNAHAGVKYGIPFPVLLRSSFGVMGANIPAMMRALVACGWFGIQTYIGGSALYFLSQRLLPNTVSLPQVLPNFMGISSGEFLAFMIFWLINILVIIRGLDSIKFLQTYAAPLLLLMGATLLGWAIYASGGVAEILKESTQVTKSNASALLGAGITGGVAFWGTLALNIPDFSRFAKSQRDQIIGQSIGLVPTMTAFAFVGAIVTNATVLVFGTRISDPVALLDKIGGPFTTILAMFGLAIATLTTNLAANIVSPANDFSNLSPKNISFRKGALIAACIGIIICPWKLYTDAANYIFTWLIGYGALLGSVSGIMICDYYLLKNKKLDLEDLYRRGGRYEYSGGFNYVAIFALVLGILPNIPGFLAALDVIETSPLFAAIYDRAWFVAFFVAGTTHFAGTKLFHHHLVIDSPTLDS